MGAEKGFTELLRLQIAGEQGTPAGLNWKGGTPNHWALAAATAYGYAEVPFEAHSALDQTVTA